MAAQAKQTGNKSDTGTVKTSTTSSAATGTGQPTGATAQPTAQPATQTRTASRPAPSARSGIRLNVGLVHTALSIGNSSRAVKAIQYAIADRGFDPGTRSGYFDQATVNAYAAYQKSIGETADGVPTHHSLDYLGFDII